jgi:hypothetical protein
LQADRPQEMKQLLKQTLKQAVERRSPLVLPQFAQV